MNLQELKDEIDAIELNSAIKLEHITVCIPNNKGGFGGTSVTGVKMAGKGIDWDNDKFIIFPETKMNEMVKVLKR